MEEDTSQTLTKHYRLSRGENKNVRREDDDDDDDDYVDCDAEAWETLSKSFKDVQSVLDHNRTLIKQVNDNHRSKVPDSMVQNVSLIREINGNISKVMGIYTDLSVNFNNIVQQRRAAIAQPNNSGNNTSTSTSNA